MKMIVAVALALVAVAAAAPAAPAAPVDRPDPIKIVRSDFEQTPEGGYEKSFETENGIKVQETGEIKKVLNEKNEEVTIVVVRGSYSYPDEEGKEIIVNYVADENGYRAEGDSIPKAPVARR